MAFSSDRKIWSEVPRNAGLFSGCKIRFKFEFANIAHNPHSTLLILLLSVFLQPANFSSVTPKIMPRHAPKPNSHLQNEPLCVERDIKLLTHSPPKLNFREFFDQEFLQAGCPSFRQTNSVNSTDGLHTHFTAITAVYGHMRGITTHGVTQWLKCKTGSKGTI